jgi:hypothetical protein
MSTTTEDPTTTTEASVDKVAPGNLWKREADLELPDGRQALIRLPNQFQHADIRQAALAAKARRMRQLRDPHSDAYVVLEDDMDALARGRNADILIDELLGREWWKDQLAAMGDVGEEEAYEHIERDKERWEELNEADPLTREKDEWEELSRHVAEYHRKVQERVDEIRQPRRDALAALDINALVDLVREERITQEGNATFNLHFSLWQVYSGSHELAGIETRTVKGRPVELPQPGKPIFNGIEDARTADPNVLDALVNAFAELEASYNEALQGNS